MLYTTVKQHSEPCIWRIKIALRDLTNELGNFELYDDLPRALNPVELVFGAIKIALRGLRNELENDPIGRYIASNIRYL